MAKNYKNYIEDETSIHAYVHGRLEGQARIDFEKALSLYPELAKEVLLRKQLVFLLQNKEAVQATQNLTNWLNDNPLELEPQTWREKWVETMTRPWFWGVSLAVCILLGWGVHEYRLNALAKAHFTHFESRSLQDAEDTVLQQALKHYNQKQYVPAATGFDAYLQGKDDDLEIRLYAGVSHLANGESSLALSQLIVFQEDIMDVSFKSFQQEGQYYLALTYLRLGKKGKAIEILRKITDLAAAKALLQQLK